MKTSLHAMEPTSVCVRLFVLLAYVSILVTTFFTTVADARVQVLNFEGSEVSKRTIHKSEHTEADQSYGLITPLSPAPLPSPDKFSPLCMNPPSTYTPHLPFRSPPPPTPQSPSPSPNPPEHATTPPTTIPSPPHYGPSPPKYASSPPQYTPSPPKSVSSPPQYTPRPPKNFSGPPQYTPSPPKHVPSPPQYTPSPPKHVSSPPQYTPSPPKHVPSPPQYTPSPPKHVPSPPQHTPSPPIYQPPMVKPPPPPPHKKPQFAVWCVAKPTVPDPIIQEAMDYACGSGADCKSIQPNQPCFQPNTLFSHASYAFNSYWQNTKLRGGTCDFGGTAMLVTTDPSFDDCHFICK